MTTLAAHVANNRRELRSLEGSLRRLVGQVGGGQLAVARRAEHSMAHQASREGHRRAGRVHW